MRSRPEKGTWLAVLAVGLCLSLAAVQARGSGRQTQQFHQTYALSSNGQVSLENTNGDVHITGWDQNEVKIDAVKTVWSGTSLNEVRIEVDSHPNSIHIETKVPHSWLGSQHWRVDYTLMVPRHASIDKADLVNGRIEIENMAGDVDASSVNGRIQAQDLSGGVDLSAVNGSVNLLFDTTDVSQPVSLKSVNGSISLTLPPDTNATLSVHTLNGGITCDFPVKINSGYVGHSLEATLGKGGGEIKLETVNGRIGIHRGSAEVN